ncbi:MAG: hypothetical protein J3Q66DRAFT_352670 [Benniella sp.]|nr:MAG: hypothetical protein J3Q66DRAFT_352670 [Benniella sp.]
MAIKNPLDLPEIRELLATFLTSDDLARCVRVSKGWHSLFLPYLWSTLDILPRHRKRLPSLEAMQRYKDHVRHLTYLYQEKAPDGYQSLQFPALSTLHIHILKAKNLAIEMAGNYSSLTHLELNALNIIKWIPPAGLSNLTSLNLTRIAVDLQDKDTRWNFLSKLETLELYQSSISTLSESMMGSCRIRYMRLEAVVGLTPTEQLKWIEHCTYLKRLTWNYTCNLSGLIEGIAQLAAANTWPDLEEFHTSSFMATDRQASLIINGMRRVLGFTINFNQPFDLVKTALRPHFPWLKRLIATRSCGTNSGFAIELLKSCPKLEDLRVGPIQVRDMLDDDTPWACESSLRYLGGGFNVDEGIEEAGQRVLLERLSRFHNLELLSLVCEPPRSKTLDLRLESGLNQLATLTRLQAINVRHTGQEMTMNEVEWIIKHWKNLRRFIGALHYNDDKSREMIARLREAGISTERWR